MSIYPPYIKSSVESTPAYTRATYSPSPPSKSVQFTSPVAKVSPLAFVTQVPVNTLKRLIDNGAVPHFVIRDPWQRDVRGVKEILLDLPLIKLSNISLVPNFCFLDSIDFLILLSLSKTTSFL